MNILCFVCKQIFIECDFLFRHLKFFHSLAPNDTYKCGFSSCKQLFTSFKSFCKHMRSEAKEVNVNQFSQCDLNNVESSEDILQSTNELSQIPDADCKNINSISNNDLNINLVKLKKCSVDFLLTYYAKKNFARKETINLQNDLVKKITSVIGEEIGRISSTLNPDNICAAQHYLKQLASFCENPFEEYDTEYKFVKMLESCNMYEEPKIVEIDNSVTSLRLKNINTLNLTVTKGVLLPIKFQLKKYFEIPGVFEMFIENIEKLSVEPKLKNFINGSVWKKKVHQFTNKIVFPYFLYFDDFEVNNPLGSHASSLLGIYYSFPTAPVALRHKLSNIFVAALFRTHDVKKFGNDKCFFNLIDILNDLEKNGLEIETKSGTKTVYFVLGLIVGDNLALNNILGFSRSFSSNYFCRFCKANKLETRHSFTEEINKLRNKTNYTDDIITNNVNETGIRENSIFNNIGTFHVTDNFAVDILHDIFEGILKYDFCNIILLFIRKKTFDLELLNIRKQNFNYGETEIGNMSPPFQLHQLKKFSIKLSGREMLTFAHFFPLIIGDLVSEDSELWSFVINLIELLDLLLLSEFTDLDILNLEQHVLFHNKQYTSIFSDTLKPKHHFLNHYCNIIKQSGPLKYLWTFPFESKHRELKSYIKNINSRKNVTLSISLKYCMQYSEFISNFKLNSYIFSHNKYCVKSSQFYNELKLKINKSQLLNCTCYQHIEINGTLYKKDFIIFSYTPDFTAYKIKEILCLHGKALLLCQEIQICAYKKHFLSYLVGSDLSTFELFNTENLSFPPVHLYTLNGQTFLRPKVFF